MSPTEAAKLLEVPGNATPEEVEARFLELRRKLEDKIAKAPTPGLQAKYRESLNEITAAFETLALAADSSALPVLQKQGPKRAEPGSGAAVPSTPLTGSAAAPAPARATAKRKSGGKEFAIVALIAVVLLGAGGWFVMKTRAENAEKERIVAEAKAEQERQAEAARLAAEQKKQAEEAERQRQEQLIAQVRGDLAEAKIAWEAIEREERTAERRLAELKSDLRNLRDAPAPRLAEAQAVTAAQQDYSEWLSNTLARHPARVARSRAEEMLSARQADAAQVALQELVAALRALEAEIPAQRAILLDLDGELSIKTNPEATWTLTESFGRTRSGQGPAELKDVSLGKAELKLSRAGWPDRVETVIVRRTQPAVFEGQLVGTDVVLATIPAGARVFDPAGKEIGASPLTLKQLSPGSYRVLFRLPGHYDEPFTFNVPEAGATAEPIKLRARPTTLVKPKWRLPERFIAESSSSYVTDGSRSTGTFAKDAHSYAQNFSSYSKTEWRLLQRDAEGKWIRFEQKVLSNQSPQMPAGVVVRYERRPDGKFAGTVVAGMVSDPATLNALAALVFDETWGGASLDEFWPPENTPIGGTWRVPGKSAVGTLVAWEKLENADWVTLQIVTESNSAKEDVETSTRSTRRVRINLGEGYVGSDESTGISSMTVKGGFLIGNIGTDTRSQSKSTIVSL